MAVVFAIQHWHHFLMGREFVVFSNQKSLKDLLQQRVVSMDQQNWLAKLLGFRFQVIYKLGRKNKVVDVLSRIHEGELSSINSAPVWLQGHILHKEVKKDVEIQQIISHLQHSTKQHPGFSIQNGVLLYKGCMVISRSSALISDLLTEFHTTPMGGHSGFLQTYRRLAGNLYWKGMKKTVKEFLQSCDTCQRHKYEATSPLDYFSPCQFLIRFGKMCR